MKVWVTRDKENKNVNCAIFLKRPSLDPSVKMFINSQGNTLVAEHRAKTFKSIFGFTPRKGSCKQYELSLTEIE